MSSSSHGHPLTASSPNLRGVGDEDGDGDGNNDDDHQKDDDSPLLANHRGSKSDVEGGVSDLNWRSRGGAGSGDSSSSSSSSSSSRRVWEKSEQGQALLSGKMVILLSRKGPKQIKLKLDEDQLKWEVFDSSKNKLQRFKVNMLTVASVAKGKRSPLLLSEACREQEEDRCLSLIYTDKSLDLEAHDKKERDDLHAFFVSAIDGLKKESAFSSGR